jgi:hypothetical protein
METTQGKSLCSYLYLKLPKCHFLVLSAMFFFYKIREQEGGTGLWRAGTDGTIGRGRWQGRG